MNKSVLTINHVYKDFGQTSVLKDISIDTEQGELLVLIGPSGCGKSTLLNCIAGFEEPTSGSISLLDDELIGKSPGERDIAMVFQSYALYPTMSVEKNITFAMSVQKMDKRTQKQKLTQVAEKLQLTELLHRKPAQLSGGQRQRVAMARALVREPKLFLFDEPLSNLDAKLRVSMRTEIKRLHQELGTTMVYVTHDQIEAMTLATKIAVLQDGMVKQVGSPYDIYYHPTDCFVAQFMGSPSMNLIEATATPHEKGTSVKFQSPEHDFELNTLQSFAELNGPQSILLGIRPENFSLSPTPSSEQKNQIKLKVEIIEPAGSDNYIISSIKASMGVEPITIRLPSNILPNVGDWLNLEISNMQSICLFDPKTKRRIQPITTN